MGDTGKQKDEEISRNSECGMPSVADYGIKAKLKAGESYSQFYKRSQSDIVLLARITTQERLTETDHKIQEWP